MAPITLSSSTQRESHHERPLPGGVWHALEQAAAASTSSAVGVWSALHRTQAGSIADTSPGIYTTLAQIADPAHYQPQALADLVEEQVVEGDQTFTVLRSATGTYLRLTAPETALWHLMDGSHTVAQLATIGFLRFKLLLPVVDLVQTLRSQGFLTDPPIAVYTQLDATLEVHTAEGWGRRVIRALREHTFAINTIDRPYTAIYHLFGWALFSRIAQVMYVAVGGAGLVAFVWLLFRNQPVGLTDGARNVPLALLALYGALLVSFVLHESAHALAVKHYGRRVQRGGVMLYFGLPAAFVDTSDIWVAGRKARMVVSAAGPISDLMVGGLAALLVSLFPNWPLASMAYRLAMACYVATLFNLNPLLELDGYFILVDALRLPNLRERALTFVSGPMWQKLRQHAPFSREERIFRAYGVLTVVYSVVAIVLAGAFWNKHLNTVFDQLWRAGWGGKIAALLLTLVVIVPVAVGVALAAWGAVRAAAMWVQRRGYGRQPVVSAAALVALVIVLALRAGAPDLAGTWLATALQVTFWAVAMAALVVALPDYKRANLAWMLYAFTGMAGVALLASTASWFVLADATRPIWGLALLLLLLGSFVALLDVDIRGTPVWELVATTLLLGMAFVIGALAFYQAQTLGMPIVGFGAYLFVATPAYCGGLALTLLLPLLLSLRDSRLLWSWVLVWVGTFAQTVAYVLEITPAFSAAGQASLARVLDIMAAGLWAGAWYVQLITLRQVSAEDTPWPHQPAMSEVQRLQRAFRLCYAGCYRLMRDVYGSRRAQALDDRMDVLAATANWDVTLDNEQARIGLALAESPLDRQGERYAEVLRYTVAVIEELAGASFARRAIRSAYDALPWPERESANRRCFPDTPWAAALSSAFGSARDGRIRLLRQVALFAHCDDDELIALATTLEAVRARAGHQIVASGTAPKGVWIVEAGEVAVWAGQQMLEELHRGAHFGVTGLQAGPSERSYRATVDSALLFLPIDAFQRLVAGDSSRVADGLRTSEALRFLERVPLFADMPRHTLRGLAMVVQRTELAPRTLVVREGVPSGTFYLIHSGRAAVIARDPAIDDTASAQGVSKPANASSPLKVVAQLGPEEFFGELELLRGTPPIASVVALTPLSVLTLPHEALRALLTGSSIIARDLEQIGTGRLLDLRRRAGKGMT